MSQLDEIIYSLVDKKCPLDDVKEYLKNIEVDDENITKIEQIENLIELHEETARRLRQIIRLMTGKYYIKRVRQEAKTNTI